MNEQQQLIVAELNAETAMALIEVESMKVDNYEAFSKGEKPKHDSKKIMQVRDDLARSKDYATERFRNAY